MQSVSTKGEILALADKLEQVYVISASESDVKQQAAHHLRAYAELITEHDKEIGEFQDEVRNLVIERSGAPDSLIDGAGSDAGWQEFTLAEIGQGFAYLKDQHDATSNSDKGHESSIENIRQHLAQRDARIKELDAVCSEMRQFLQSIPHLVPLSFYDKYHAVLSTDCGKDLLAQHEAWRKALEYYACDADGPARTALNPPASE